MIRRLALPTLAAVAALLPATPAAADDLVPRILMDDRAVTATTDGGAVTFHFSRSSAEARAAYRRIAGKRVRMSCLAVTRKTPSSPPQVGVQTTVDGPRVGRRLGAVRVTLRGAREFDMCSLAGPDEDSTVAMASITADGKAHLEESRLAGEMLLATATPDAEPKPVAEVVAAGRTLVVALATPEDTPPAGKIGYWSDATRYVVVAVTSAGRRLFWDSQGDVVRTNMFWLLS